MLQRKPRETAVYYRREQTEAKSSDGRRTGQRLATIN